MTSISQPVLPPQTTSTASQSVAQAQPNSASLSGRTPPQAAGTAPPPPARSSGSAQHGKADSISLNGKAAITPAVPAVGGAPTIVNGNTSTNSSSGPSDHSRKASITITPAGASGYLPNGGQLGGKPAGGKDIQFGTFNKDGSPALANAVPQLSQSSNSLAVNPPQNPRITSPAASPSPIPQPPASGGRPPSSFQGQTNGMSFGSMHAGDDPSRQMRPGMQQSNLGPGPQPTHLRRESSQSAHSEMGTPGMGPGANRGGYPPQSGRGGRQYSGQYGQQQQMGYGQNPNFRAPSQPRGAQNIPSPYQQRQSFVPPYPNSPHQAARSPALAHSQPAHHPQPGQVPMTNPAYMYGGYAPSMGQPQVKPHSSSFSQKPPHLRKKESRFPNEDSLTAVQALDLSPETGHFDQFLTEIKQNQQFMQPMDPQQQQAAFYHFQMLNGGIYNVQIPPGSPRPQQQLPQGMQQQYTQGQYGFPQQQPPQMARTPSTMSMSAERPPSSMGKPQTPMPTPAVSNTPISTRPANSPAPKSANTFKIPEKKRAGIVIRDPNSGAVKSFDKKSTSPAPPTPSPAVVPATPTPPPQSASGADTSHNRTESKGIKSNEEKRNDMKDAIARKVEEDKADEQRKKEEQDSKAATEKKEAEDKLAKEREEAEAKELAAAKAQMEAEEAAAKAKAEAAQAEKAADKAKEEAEEQARKEREEEEEFARIEAEMERQEREAEERYQRKKQAEKEESERKAAEAAKTHDEDMKRAEREAEEAEEARLKKLAEGESDPSQRENKDLFAALKKDGAATPSSDAPTAAETPVESGSQTPASEPSMPPPRAAASKQKPAALKLETAKAVEPPQPSAQLLSLRSARRLTSLNDVSYPPAIASPNPALNTAAPMGKFRYDKNFLVQFQGVFVEKPSEDWTNKIKETLGASEDAASARTGSARPGGSLGPRAPSKTGPGMPPMGSMGGGMGSFGARPSGPPGNTSEARFKASTQQLAGGQRPMQNPLAQFVAGVRPGGGFPMGGPQKMDQRVPSTGMASHGSHPHSPRGNSSQRGTSGRASKGGRTRENDKDAKNMPLTAGAQVKPIEKSETGWKPMSVGQGAFGMAGPPPGGPGGDNHLAPDIVQRKVKSNLNKMTPNNFDKISDQILAIAAQSKDETDGRTLRQVIQLTFHKATDEAHWAEMYAQFCKRMLESMSPEIKDESILNNKGEVATGGALFRKYLLTRCQTEFEQGWKVNLPEKPEGESEEAVMLSDEYYIAAAAKRRGLGLVRFIGELFKLNMLTERIMHECVKKLVDYEGVPDEAEVESLTSLLKTIGANLDATEKGHQLMDIYFVRIKAMTETPNLPSRLKFMLMDIGDLRKKNWQSGKAGAIKGPATLEAVRAEAVEAERQKELQRQADSSSRRGGGGGGRPPAGRGDARNFSGGGQYGMMPPPDYQRNTVGMDDLRRLGRGGSRQASQAGPPSLGPPSMFGPRGSNTRKPLGPGFSRAGEDSGASSRTGTPPAQKEKKEKDEKEAAAKHTNAFSALAGLDNAGEPADPASPPSNASSPPTTKPSLAQAQRSKSPLGNKEDKREGEVS
ncbi:MAG: hypothetical protein Q9207_005339 [Kuettlingeria erythrocarpa]